MHDSGKISETCFSLADFFSICNILKLTENKIMLNKATLY